MIPKLGDPYPGTPLEVRPVDVDCQQLMLQLSRMANMPFALVRKMVLVLEIDCAPILHVETFMSDGLQEQLKLTELLVSEEPAIMQKQQEY